MAKPAVGGLARNSRAEACARLEHHRGASSEAPLRDYVMPGAILCRTQAPGPGSPPGGLPSRLEQARRREAHWTVVAPL